METLNIKNDKLSIWLSIAFTALVGMFNLVDVKISLVLVIGLSISFVFYLKPHYALAALILLSPFASTPILSQKMAGVPGLKIANLMFFAVFMAYVASRKKFKIKSYETYFTLGITLLLGIAVVRGIPHLKYINYYFEENMGVSKYFMTHFVKPVFYLAPFLIITGYIRDKKDITFISLIFNISMFALSTFILIYYLLEVSNKSDLDIVRYEFANFFNMHTNNLSLFLTLGYPLLLSSFLHKKKLFSTINLLLVLICIAILYSRTAYVLVVFSTLMLIGLEKKAKFLPILIVFGICAVYISPSTVIERSMTGIEDRNLQKFSAGRVENIWIPLLEESKKNPIKVLVGGGRYSIVYSRTVDKGHAHNMYIGTFLDTGIIGLSFFIAFFAYLLALIKKGLKHMPDGKRKTVLRGIFVSIVAFLLSGLTGRSFFPDTSNTYLWIIIALGLSIIRHPESGPPTEGYLHSEKKIHKIHTDFREERTCELP